MRKKLLAGFVSLAMVVGMAAPVYAEPQTGTEAAAESQELTTNETAVSAGTSDTVVDSETPAASDAVNETAQAAAAALDAADKTVQAAASVSDTADQTESAAETSDAAGKEEAATDADPQASSDLNIPADADAAAGTGTDDEAALAGTESPASGGTQSSNYSNNKKYVYDQWSSPVKSYLYDNGDGTLTRVEYTGSKIIHEIFNSQYQLVSSASFSPELSLFGGFYHGSDANYIVVGQNNMDQSDTREVVRVIKYSFDWQEKGSCSLYGANTYIPFEAGSLRFAESGDYLIIRTCHTMYGTDVHHQANLSMEVNTSSMKVMDSFSMVWNIANGYVSHSFNQFVQTDGNQLITVDHGDSYPRALVLCRYDNTIGSSELVSGTCSSVNAIEFLGKDGDNYTGATVGGFEVSGSSYLIAGTNANKASSISSSDKDHTQNVFVSATSKSDFTAAGTKVTYLTDYADASGIRTTVPQLVKMSTDKYMVLWQEYNAGSALNPVVYYMLVDGKGNKLSSKKSTTGYLPDCHPIVLNGIVTWYYTKNSAPVFCQAKEKPAVSANPSATAYYNQTEDKTAFSGGTVVNSDGAAVSGSWQAENGSTVYSSAGTKDILADFVPSDTQSYETLKGITLKVNVKPLALLSSDVSSVADQVYTASKITPAVTVTHAGKQLVKDTDYSISYGENIETTGGSITVTGKGNYSGSITVKFGIYKISVASDAVSRKISDTGYSGAVQHQKPQLTYNGNTLTEGKDYTLTYPDSGCINEGTYRVTAVGTGLYTGSVTLAYKINKVDMSAVTVTIPQSSYEYTGTAITPLATVTYSGTKLTAGTDYNVTYGTNLNAGSGSVTVTGSGHYTGTVLKNFTISKASLSNAVISQPENTVYNGKAHVPAVTVTYKGRLLTNGVDYSLTYKNNTDAGLASITASGIPGGNYTGTILTTFAVIRANGSLAVAAENVSYGTVPKVTVTENISGAAVTLQYKTKGAADSAYTAEVPSNAGTYTVRATAAETNNYCSASATADFTILQMDISKVTVTAVKSFVYNGRTQKPVPVLTFNGNQLRAGTDYVLNIPESVQAGAYTADISGKGNFSGLYLMGYSIGKLDLSSAEVSVPSQSYTGKELKPAVAFTSGVNLLAGKDYTLSYKNNINAGTAGVTISGTGSCTGTKSLSFSINRADISKAVISGVAGSYIYKNAAVAPVPSVSMNGTVLRSGTDYTVSYKDNNAVGTAYVIITGSGNYSGTVSASFKLERRVADGCYLIRIQPQAGKEMKTLDVTGASSAEGANIQSYSPNGSAAQLFLVKDAGNGYYRIENLLTGKALDVAGGAKSNGANVQQWDWNGSDAQLWSILPVGTDGWKIIGKGSGKALDVAGASTADGANVRIWNDNGSSAQIWNFVNSSLSLSDSRMKAVLSGGTVYKWTGAAVQPEVQVALNGKALVRGRDYQVSYKNNIRAQAAAETGGGNAEAVVTGIGSYSGTLILKFTILKCSNQPEAGKTYVIVSAANMSVALDVRNGSIQNGSVLQLWDRNGSKAQKFTWKSLDGSYMLESEGSTFTLDVSGGWTGNGGKMQIYTENRSGAQQWRLRNYTDGSFAIINAVSGKAIDIPNGNIARGAALQTYTANDTAAQRFCFVETE